MPSHSQLPSGGANTQPPTTPGHHRPATTSRGRHHTANYHHGVPPPSHPATHHKGTPPPSHSPPGDAITQPTNIRGRQYPATTRGGHHRKGTTIRGRHPTTTQPHIYTHRGYPPTTRGHHTLSPPKGDRTQPSAGGYFHISNHHPGLLLTSHHQGPPLPNHHQGAP